MRLLATDRLCWSRRRDAGCSRGRRRGGPSARSSSGCSATAPGRPRSWAPSSAPAMHDYIALVNTKGGVEGHKIKALEIDHEYKVPPGGGVLRAPQEGRRGDHRRLRHAAHLRARRQADGGPDPRHLARASAAPPPPTAQRYPYIFPIAATYWSQARRRGGLRQEAARRQPQGQEDRATSSTTTRPAASRSRCSRTSRAWRASSSRPSRCRRPAWRWAPRCSTSPSASAPTS